MALSGAERARRCREKKKAAGLGEIMKKKDRLRKRLARSKMTPFQLKELRSRQKTNLQRFRAKKKDEVLQPRPLSAFSNKQAKGKVMKKIRKVLPINQDKQIEVVHQLAQDLGILGSDKIYQTKFHFYPIAIKRKNQRLLLSG